MTKCHILVGRELPFCLSKTSGCEMPLNKKKNHNNGSFNMVGLKGHNSNFFNHNAIILQFIEKINESETVVFIENFKNLLAA